MTALRTRNVIHQAARARDQGSMPHVAVGWSGTADRLARWIGRIAARTRRMDLSAASRGILARETRQQDRFEGIVRAFRLGYDGALATGTPSELVGTLETVAPPLRGFAYEGAAMALAVRQTLSPRHPPLVQDFITEYGDPYTYLMHVGVGWTYGMIPGAADLFDQVDPLLRWLTYDGMGFAHCFFRGVRSRRAVTPPSWVMRGAYAGRAFDQGVGRCLWFCAGGSVEPVRDRLAGYSIERLRDLWSGIGLAVVYAGRPDEAALRSLRAASDPFRPDLAQGAAFAAKALQRAGQLDEWHDGACRILCGVSAAGAASVTDDALLGLPFDQPDPAYELWRRRTQSRLSESSAVSLSP